MTVVVVGAYGAAMSYRVPHAPAAGETLLASELVISHGGKGSNQAVGAGRLGVDVVLMTALGADAYADAARQLWHAEGVESAEVVSPQPTMTGVILLEASGENRIVVAPGALGDLSPDYLREQARHIRDARICLVSLEIPVPAAREALTIAREWDVLTVLNPAPAQANAASLLQLADVITPNESEARALTGVASSTYDALLAELRRRAPSSTVIITLGRDGAIWAGPGGAGHVLAPAVNVEDTTGAGDAFNAALAVALHESASMADAVRFAVAAGSYAVTRRDVLPALAHRSELEAFMAGTFLKESCEDAS